MLDSKSQFDKFEEVARKLETDDDEGRLASACGS